MRLAILTALALAACTTDGADVSRAQAGPVFGPIQTRLMEGDLVAISVEMQGAADTGEVNEFTDCAAAQYALIRGASFVRRVTNDVTKSGRSWHGAGVYTLSDAHPGGVHTIDAEVMAQACRDSGVPLV